MVLNKEETILVRRIQELAKKAFHKGIRTYTDFLNLNEISIFHSMEKELAYVPYAMYGGYENAERVMICFYGDLESSTKDLTKILNSELEEFPITCLHIFPSNQKFASELDHRDYLGAIMNTGTTRNKIGDIHVVEKEAYVYCDEVIGNYLKDSLTRIRHNNVVIEIAKEKPSSSALEYKEVVGSVSSFRLDSMVALAFHTSRSGITGLIEGEKVFVNSRLIKSNSYMLKEGDVVSVRGYGKFRFESQGNLTKKGRIYAKILLYGR